MAVSPFRVLVAIVLWLVVMLTISAFYLWSWLQSPHPIPQDQQHFTISKGETLNQVANRLHDADIIRWPRAWSYYSQLFDAEPIKAGEYMLPDHASPLEVLNQFQAGEVMTYPVTFIEGWTFRDILKALNELPNIEHNLRGVSPEEIIAQLGLDIRHPEGWFFPDTYYYVAGDSDSEILRRAHYRMQYVLELEWRGRAVGLPYSSPYEALIMASIIEKETGVPEERDEIAGVFVRRLERGMRLQTDPTVIYGLGESFDGNLRRKHLGLSNPYNTYMVSGLPPTPIAMPGQEAIHAALHPKAGEALYFVARGDGSHYFSSTLEEHAEAVRRFQKSGRREDYRSAPPPSLGIEPPLTPAGQEKSDENP